MKSRLIIFMIYLSINTFAQTSTEKWNDLYKRYEYFDSNNRMTGYKQYNSIYQRWEYFDLKQNNNTEGYEIQQPTSSVNINLVNNVLTNLQRKYDNMTAEEKRKYSESYDYSQKKSYVSSITIDFVKNFVNQDMKERKQFQKIFQKISRKNFISIDNFKDGWYKCYLLFENNLADERIVYIKYGKIITYLNKYNNSLQFTDYKINTNNIYSFKRKLDNLDIETKIVFIDEDEVKEPKINQNGRLMFYTQSNVSGGINIIVKGKNGYYSGPKIRTINYTPNCEISNNEDFYIFLLLPGKYTYKAFTETEVWENEIEIFENECKRINLTN